MDTASRQPAHLVLPVHAAAHVDAAPTQPATSVAKVPAGFVHELWQLAEGRACELTPEEFGAVLTAVGDKFNFGMVPGRAPSPQEIASFLRSLHLADLALASACALGREAAWQRFMELYRTRLTQAATSISGSATRGNDLADSLYGELYGLRDATDAHQAAAHQAAGHQAAGPPAQGTKRGSPLASYSGRGSLMGWLRTTLAQRHIDHHRRTRRETPLESLDVAAPDQATVPMPAALADLTEALGRTLAPLGAEDRFLLSAYFLDRQTLLQISRTLHVHEATISRRIKRLTVDLRGHLLLELQAAGLSKRGAEEALGTDPRDLEINLRSLLQSSHGPPFPYRDGKKIDTQRRSPSGRAISTGESRES